MKSNTRSGARVDLIGRIPTPTISSGARDSATGPWERT